MIRPARTPAPDEDDFELDVDLGGVAPGAPVPASVPAVELVALGRVFGSEPPVVAADRWPAAGLDVLALGRAERRPGPPALVVLRQEGPCPARYPRRAGLPAKRPLF